MTRTLAAALLLLPVVAAAAEPVVPAVREPALRGQLRSSRHAVLSAGMAGILTDMPADSGGSVRQGEVVAVFDCSAEQADRDVAVAKLQGARAKLSVNQRLAQAKNIGLIDVELSRAEAGMVTAELRRIEAHLRHCTVQAPFPGTVVERRVQAHEYVALGAPLLELVDPASLEIEMVVPSRMMARLGPGTPFRLRVDENGQEAGAVVDRVVDVIDPVSQTLRVIGRLTQPNAALKPGMSGDVVPEAR
jgi:RND family efflux transporter MFP subunit